MKILIGGDLCPINSNKVPFELAETETIFQNFAKEIQSADFSVVNLESPLTFSKTKSPKSGANLKASPHTINGIKAAGFDLLSAANNHIGDFGEKGISETIETCKKNKIPVIGVGNNHYEASKPYIFELDKIRIGILAFADTEFGMASQNRAGANPFDLISSIKAIEKLKSNVDFVIVLLHEGKEYYQYPSPDLQQICRFLIERGANLIVCQHSHVIGAWEEYRNGDIFYGQGNLIFDYANRKSKEWLYGFLINVELTNGKKKIKLIPYKQNFPGIRPLSDLENEWFWELTSNLKKKVNDESFIKKNWIEFSKNYTENYISILKGHGKIRRKLFKLLKLYRVSYSQSSLLTILNITRSRVHREMIRTILEQNTKEND